MSPHTAVLPGVQAAPAHRSRIAPAAFFALAYVSALVLHVHGLQHLLLGGDELHALRAALINSWGGIWSYYDVSDNSIPYTLWGKLLIESGRFDEVAFRLPVVLSDALLLASPLLFRRQVGVVVALVAIALLGTSPLIVFYAVVARPYLPAALAIVLALRAWDAWLARPSAARLVAFAAASIASVFLHLYCLFPVATLLALALLAVRRGTVRLRAVAGAALLVGFGSAALLGPGLAGLIEQRLDKVGGGEPLWTTLATSYRTLTGGVALVAWALPALAVAGAVRLLRRTRRLGTAAIAVVLVQVAALCATRPLGEASVFARYFFPVLPALLLLAAAGVEAVADACVGGARRLLGRGAAAAASPARCAEQAAVLALLLGAGLAASVPLQSPMLLFSAGRSSLRSGKEFLHDAEAFATFRGSSSRVVRALLAQLERGDVVLVFPEPTGATSFGDLLRVGLLDQRIRVASERAPWLRERGVTYRHVLDVFAADELRASGASHLLVRLAGTDERVLRRLTADFGVPQRDARYALFDLEQAGLPGALRPARQRERRDYSPR